MGSRPPRTVLCLLIFGIACDALPEEFHLDTESAAVTLEREPGESESAGEPALDAASKLDPDQAFLQQVFPIPGHGQRIRYAISGAVSGSLDVELVPGGFARERWTVTKTTEAGVVSRSGQRVTTPELVWTLVDGAPPRIEGRPWTALSHAYAEEEPAVQHAWTQELQRWSEELTAHAHDHPGPADVELERPCLRVELGGARACVWEDLGVLARYITTTVEIRAIERMALTQEQADAASGWLPEHLDEPPTPDPQELAVLQNWLYRAAQGDPVALSRFTRPRLSALSPEELAAF